LDSATADAPRRENLTSGQVCEASGISRGALRLYEREGLIASPPRSHSGYRLYPGDTVDLVAAIKIIKTLGFGLAEVREVLALASGDEAAAAKLRATAVRRLQEIDERIEGLRDLRECIAAFLDGESFDNDEDCAALARLLKRQRAVPSKSRRASR
jgi:DNA-binding transcriptional MerR regulator